MDASPTALITGSTSGIGAAAARALAADGYHVVITGRDERRGQAVVADVEHAGGNATFVPSDLRARPNALRAFAAEVGEVDVLVHNAAVCYAVDTLTLSDEQLDETMAINIRAPQVLTAAFAPAMVERGAGAIVVIGSWMAVVGTPSVGFYSASKAAEEQLTRNWAAEFGPRGIRVNTVAPGATRTPINASAGDVLDQMTSVLPAGRPGTPDQIAAAVAWLVSERAAYIHGATIAVDGGITATRSF